MVSSFAAVNQTIFFARGWSSIPQFKNDDSWHIIMRPRVTSACLFGSVSTCCPKAQPSIRNSRDGQWICRAVVSETVRWFSGCHVSCPLQSGERRRWDNGGLDWGLFGIVLNLTIPWWTISDIQDLSGLLKVFVCSHTPKAHYLIVLNVLNHSMWIRGQDNIQGFCPIFERRHLPKIIGHLWFYIHTPVYTRTFSPTSIVPFSLYQPYTFPCIAPHRSRLPDLIATYCSFRVLLSTHGPW